MMRFFFCCFMNFFNVCFNYLNAVTFFDENNAHYFKPICNSKKKKEKRKSPVVPQLLLVFFFCVLYVLLLHF